MLRAFLMLFLLVAAAPARAQDGLAQELYGQIEDKARAEYEAMWAETVRQVSLWPAVSPSEEAKRTAALAREKQSLKIWSYNKAVLLSLCAAEAERAHPPAAPRVPAEQNVLLRTCVEERLELIRKFRNTVSYAGRFFPERLEPCEKRARLPEQEKQFPPYGFLDLDEPKLYDFELYNRCLMTMP